jgi:alkaline phosphatase D
MPLKRREWLRQASQAALACGAATGVGGCALTLASKRDGADLYALGVASGHPLPHGVVLWTRLMGADLPASVAVHWQVALDESFTRVVAKGTEVAESAWAHSVHAEPTGLRPATWYWYRFEALGARSPVGRTRTAPEAGSVQPLRLAMASCQRYDVGHYAAWRHLAAEDNLDLVVFLGDYIYEYVSAPGALRSHRGGLVRSLADYRQRYAQYKSDPALQAAHAAVPWLMVWDDHEVDNDYAAWQGQDLDAAFGSTRRAAYQAYWEHMPFPRSVRPTDGQMRIVGRYDWGQVARIITLDDRQHRDAQACPRPGRGGSNTVTARVCSALFEPQRTLLGAEQEAWLAQQWSTQHSFNVLAQQTLLARWSWQDPSASGGGQFWTDGWDGYPAARQRLLDTVAQRQVPGLVVLGGDVHANYVSQVKADYTRPQSATLGAEFCGTSITSLSLPQERVDAARAFNPHVQWARADQRGYVRLDVSAQAVQAQLRVVSDARDPQATLATQARFVVEAGRPGVQLA